MIDQSNVSAVGVPIDPEGKPCACFGAPVRHIWVAPRHAKLTGYQCTQCGRTWPSDVS